MQGSIDPCIVEGEKEEEERKRGEIVEYVVSQRGGSTIALYTESIAHYSL